MAEFQLNPSRNWLKPLVFVGLLLLALIAGCSLIKVERIDAGNVGIKVNLAGSGRGVDDITYTTGWVFYSPLSTAVYEFPVYTQHKEYEEFEVQSQDGSSFGVAPSLNYYIQSDKVDDIFRQYRRPLAAIEDGFLKTAVYEAYRVATNRYTADSLISNRGSYEARVKANLVGQLQGMGFNVQQITTKLEPPASLKAAIDAKNTAVQTGLQTENRIRQAEAQARINIAEAEGRAKAIRIAADAQAYANEKQQQSLTPLLVQMRWIEAWEKGGSAVPTYTGGNSSQFLMQMPPAGAK
ncbi:prohibitin family protein [Hymenobacter psychrotolerans]|uniref:Regulator of protease activity HflC, stomatin/prohibitin superfamily n=1 Tax=Hymenobacter psychrotolerans DSM 18569 TaxID=1121959 RepID=A0A1M6QBX1_9BACT|nr:prohibitin family protein [Hymenobacter psychrotolerans]SHK17742.1 Regulator of protease activity HflC, stomatin/prohibitin superfamily [Hymenobacter psychrotolerans DSM 18569]